MECIRDLSNQNILEPYGWNILESGYTRMWAKDREQKLRELWGNKTDLGLIAIILDVSKEAVMKKAARLKLPYRKKPKNKPLHSRG